MNMTKKEKKTIKKVHFKVDTRLASILGENYRSSEDAIKELVDNAWDADAENVWIDLPEPFTDQPIIIKDDGCGMTIKEVELEYLKIASDRISRKGEKTQKGRKVKGRKGIGKFAGFIMADIMDLKTKSRGQEVSLIVDKILLVKSKRDIEKIDLPINIQECDSNEHGTTIVLKKLNQRLNFPLVERLKERLVLEYGREVGFKVYVNSEMLKAQDIPGDQISNECNLQNAGPIKIGFSVLEKPIQKNQAGIVIRVNNKIIGQPLFFGLDEDEEIPTRLLRRIAGEIQADNIPEEDITADWSSLIANSKAYEEIKNWVRPQLKKQLHKLYKADIDRIKAKRKREINKRLSALPEYRRKYAEKQLDYILTKFYGDTQERVDVVISFILDAMEKDEYWTVLKKIEEAKNSDVMLFAESLNEFGIVDMATMCSQARSRLRFLEYLGDLVSNKETLEIQMHKAFEENLWILGVQYSIMASNKTTKKIIEEYGKKEYTGKRKNNRPDLLLTQNVFGKYLLIEFKRPSDKIGRDVEAQAKKYRDDLTTHLSQAFDIMVIGGKIDSNMSAHYEQPDIKFLSYDRIICDANSQLEWLLKELSK